MAFLGQPHQWEESESEKCWLLEIPPQERWGEPSEGCGGDGPGGLVKFLVTPLPIGGSEWGVLGVRRQKQEKEMGKLIEVVWAYLGGFQVCQ